MNTDDLPDGLVFFSVWSSDDDATFREGYWLEDMPDLHRRAFLKRAWMKLCELIDQVNMEDVLTEITYRDVDIEACQWRLKQYRN